LFIGQGLSVDGSHPFPLILISGHVDHIYVPFFVTIFSHVIMHGCLVHPFVSLTVSCFSNSLLAHLAWRQLLLTLRRLTTTLQSLLYTRNICVSWNGGIYVQHITIEGLATAGSIQGGVADATVALLNFHGINPCIKWVNNFIFFRSPNSCLQAVSCPPSF